MQIFTTCISLRISCDCAQKLDPVKSPAILLLQDLNDSMQAHLRLHFNNEEASDEQVCLFGS